MNIRSQLRRRDVLADAECAVRCVYIYVACRIGSGASAEDVTRDVLARSSNSSGTNVSLITSARQVVDERFGQSERDRELVALHLAGLDVGDIAALLRYRPEAAAVGLRRALMRLDGGPSEPRPELVDQLVDETAVPWKRPSHRPRRMLKGAVSLAALIAAVPAFGALVGDHTTDPVLEPIARSRVVAAPPATPTRSRPSATHRRLVAPKPRNSTTERPATPAAPKVSIRQDDAKAAQPAPQPAPRCGRFEAQVKALRVRNQQALAKVLERQIREKVDVFTRLRERYPEARFARKVLRERTALERRQYAEWKALLEKQRRGARELEAEREACVG